MDSQIMINFLNKLDKDVLYFIDDYYDQAFKIDLKNNVYLAKKSRGKPFKFAQESEKFKLAIIPSNEVGKEDYGKF